MHTVYISQHCPVCARFVEGVRSSPRASKEIRMVDVDHVDEGTRKRLTVVPTLQTSNGKTLAGSEAFTFLKEYEQDVELDSYEFGSSDLMFSDFTSWDGMPQTVGNFERFEPLP